MALLETLISIISFIRPNRQSSQTHLNPTTKMRFSTIITAAVGLLASSVAACGCSGVTNPGLYCGYCSQVTSGWQGKLDHAFSCAKNGDCVDHDKSSPCKAPYKYDAYHCGGRDRWKRDPEAEAEAEAEAENVVGLPLKV
jgi:hypothetical protein